MQSAHWSRAWKRDSWLRRLSGLTLPPSTLDHLAASWIASLRATPASPTALLGEASGRPMSASCSIAPSKFMTTAGLLVSSEKTSRGMRTASSRLPSRFWKDWVVALRQASSEHRASAPVTSASGSSSWPTATAVNRVRDEETLAKCAAFRKRNANQNTVPLYLGEVAENWRTPGAAMALHGPMSPEERKAKGQQVSLDDQASYWMTPNLPNGGRSAKHATFVGSTAYHNGKKVQVGLEHQTSNWSTPRASDGEKGGPNQSFTAGGIPLPSQAAHWATPTARMYRGGGQAVIRKDGKSRLDMLDWQAEAWSLSSPQSQLIYDGWTSLAPISFADPPLDGSISGPLLAEISVYRRWSQRSGGAGGWRGIWTRRPRRSLGVKFAEYLMGWPIGWTDCGCAEMEFTRWQQDMRGLLSTLCSRTPRQATLL